MYSYTRKDATKNTVEFTVTIKKETIAEDYKKAFAKLQNDLQVEGFRKGKVPAAIAEKHLPRENVYQQMIRDLVPGVYDEIIKKENLKPIVTPRIELVSAKENEDWQIRMTVAEKPKIDLSNYREAINKAKASIKKADIWVPGKSPEKKDDEKAKAQMQQELLNKILSELLTSVKIEITSLIVEEELNHRLARLVDDVQKIGLTTEAYLKSKGLTMDHLKTQYTKEIEDTYKLEFLLSEIADKEGIKVEQADLDKLFTSITDPKERESARKNSYFYATIIRKQKTLDYLLAL